MPRFIPIIKKIIKKNTGININLSIRRIKLHFESNVELSSVDRNAVAPMPFYPTSPVDWIGLERLRRLKLDLSNLSCPEFSSRNAKIEV